MNGKQIKISVPNLNAISDLCKKINIDPAIYDCIDGKLAGKLIMDLSYLLLCRMNDYKLGKIKIPNPADYMAGGKYDIK